MPLPDAPAVSVIVLVALLTGVDLIRVPVVSVTVPVVAEDDVRFEEVGEIANVQGAPACVTVKV